jgi:hypothetical protein
MVRHAGEHQAADDEADGDRSQREVAVGHLVGAPGLRAKERSAQSETSDPALHHASLLKVTAFARLVEVGVRPPARGPSLRRRCRGGARRVDPGSARRAVRRVAHVPAGRDEPPAQRAVAALRQRGRTDTIDAIDRPAGKGDIIENI